MPWNNQGGGGNQGPWGQGPSGGGAKPPDLEELLRKGQDKLKDIMPKKSGGGSNGFLIIIGLVVLAVLWASQSVYTVGPSEEGVVLRFGKYHRTTQPGLHFLAWPFEMVSTPEVRKENQEDIGFRRLSSRSGQEERRGLPNESLMLTGDQNIVDIQFTVLWRIADARDYLFNLKDSREIVRSVAESAMREYVGRSRGDQVRTEKREEVQANVRTMIQKTLDDYGAGIEINTVKLESANPPPAVADAFEDVQRAGQDRNKLVNEAKAYANKRLGDARGEAAQIYERAEAYKSQTVAEADGDAKRFVSIYKEYAKAKTVTRQRMFLETMERVLGRSDKVIIDKDSGKGVVPYLPLPEIRKRTTGAAQ